MKLLEGDSVVVVRSITEYDEIGEPVSSRKEKTIVDNVLVSPGQTQDMGAERPHGDIVEFTLQFPKSYTESLRGCQIEIRSDTYRVIGDPKPYLLNCPGEWNRSVEVEAAHG